MSTIFDQLVKHRIEEFNKCNPKGSGKHDVKPGQIVISEFQPEPVGVSGETMFCQANWRPHSYAPFFEGQRFRMNTDVLFNSVSSSRHKEKYKNSPQGLTDKMVHISDTALDYRVDKNGKTIAKYNVKWGIIEKDSIAETVTSKTAGLYVFANTGSKSKTIGEAMGNFYNQCGDYLNDAAFDEGYLDYELDDVDFNAINDED